VILPERVPGDEKGVTCADPEAHHVR
jgi:hypothetical protein